MPEQLDDAAWDILLREDDSFKLAIRGVAALEADLNAFIEEAFLLPLPGGVRSLGQLERRIAVGAALGLIPPDAYLDLFRAVVKVRHDFAHGNIDDLPEQRAAELRGRLKAIGQVRDLPDVLAKAEPHHTLLAALIIARTALRASAEVLRERRAKDKKLRRNEGASPLIAALMAEIEDKPREGETA